MFITKHATSIRQKLRRAFLNIIRPFQANLGWGGGGDGGGNMPQSLIGYIWNKAFYSIASVVQ